MTVDSMIQTIDTKIALYHKKFEEQIKQLMSNVAQCFRDPETSAKSALDRMHEEMREKTNPALTKFQAVFDERQKESFKTVMEH
eukprot:7827717-Lingulodinium_polyedra.AAC.1